MFHLLLWPVRCALALGAWLAVRPRLAHELTRAAAIFVVAFLVCLFASTWAATAGFTRSLLVAWLVGVLYGWTLIKVPTGGS